LLAVTGTNGKSTLTRLLDDILRHAGIRSAAGGNLGVPLTELAMKSTNLDWIVVEASSFQLELVQAFHPRGAILLNLQPDHLDRHGTMENYLDIKCRVFAQMRGDDYGMIPTDLHEKVIKRHVGAMYAQDKMRWIPFGKQGWHYDEEHHQVCGISQDQKVSICVQGSYFDNHVTGQTAAAAAAMSLACCGVRVAHVASAIDAFVPLPHRMQIVGEMEGVLFVDDSKATNLAAMHAAISMQKGPVRLIAGGLAKENDASWVKQVLKKRVACAYLIGSSAALFEQAWSDTIPVKQCGSLGVAMESVLRDVQEGEVVLLSPGCASFDQFRSYAERGEIFSRLVQDRICYK
jgi:UDP-N-acetylmuramoylalanine--D-glutamate ligase